MLSNLCEYVSENISSVKWLKRSSLRNEFESILITGTTNNECEDDQNSLSVWSSNSNPNQAVSPAFKLHSTSKILGDVTSLTTLSEDLVLATSACHASLYKCDNYNLQLIHNWSNLHSEICTSSVFNPAHNMIATCGQDGIISFLNFERPDDIIRSKPIAQSTLECIDVISANEFVCGTGTGHLKVYDVRSRSVEMSLGCTQASVLTSCKRNPKVPHFVACGNDQGLLSLYDLRKPGKQLLQILGHSAYITELQYKQNEDNLLFTSSFDGQLFRWHLTAECQLGSVDLVMGKEGGISLNSFDINHRNEIACSAENEVLYYGNV